MTWRSAPATSGTWRPSDGVVAHLRDAKTPGRAAGAVHGVAQRGRRRRARRAGLRLGTRSGCRQRNWRSSRTGPSSRVRGGVDRQHPPGCSSNPPLALPGDPREFPDVISQALSGAAAGRAWTVPTRCCCPPTPTKVSETTEHGYPIREHLNRLVDGEIIWAPAIDGAFVLSAPAAVTSTCNSAPTYRSGYLQHDAENVPALSGDADVPSATPPRRRSR